MRYCICLLLGVGLNLPVVATAYAQTATEPAQKDDEPVELRRSGARSSRVGARCCTDAVRLMMNLVSKRPESVTFADVSVAGGSFDTLIGAADLNRVFDSDGEIAGRLNLLHRREGSHIDYTKGVERLYAGPATRPTVSCCRPIRCSMPHELRRRRKDVAATEHLQPDRRVRGRRDRCCRHATCGALYGRSSI